jgi:predicted Zn-dependent protease
LKKLTIILCLALVSSLLVCGVSARSAVAVRGTVAQDNEVYRHEAAGIRFSLPAGWKAKPDGEVITVSTPDEALQMVFWVPDEDTLDDAVKDLGNELGKTIKNIKTTGKEARDTHNGMPHYSASGTGEVEGTTIEWSVDVLAAKKVVIILTFAAPGAWEKHSGSASKFIDSIRKID